MAVSNPTLPPLPTEIHIHSPDDPDYAPEARPVRRRVKKGKKRLIVKDDSDDEEKSTEEFICEMLRAKKIKLTEELEAKTEVYLTAKEQLQAAENEFEKFTEPFKKFERENESKFNDAIKEEDELMTKLSREANVHPEHVRRILDTLDEGTLKAFSDRRVFINSYEEKKEEFMNEFRPRKDKVNDMQIEFANMIENTYNRVKNELTKTDTALDDMEKMYAKSTCTLCLRPYGEGKRQQVSTKCGHTSCEECAERWFSSNRVCHNCRGPGKTFFKLYI